MVSTMNKAGCPAASIALRIAAIGELQPVEVSLCRTHTALISLFLSSRSRASISAGSAPTRQSVSMNSGLRPRRSAIFFQSVANWPVSTISTLSPADSVLVSAASQAPVPVAVKMMTGLVVLKMVLMPSNARLASLANSGPRWSITGRSIARRMRSGTGVGPGICRKCRPATREEFWAMGKCSLGARTCSPPALRGWKLAGMNTGCDILVKTKTACRPRPGGNL